MDVFAACQSVNEFLTAGDEGAARDALIQVLEEVGRSEQPYSPLLNQLIRATGLYPYMRVEDASWDQKFLYEAFAIDVGGQRPATLHREQSIVLGRLLEGANLAISAPTSFGKSFIIDAYIAIKNPRNVVILVPTIALMDETRRRLYRKFSDEYEIITAPDMPLGDQNIFIFPQERAFSYLNKIENLDLLVVDEFYKASKYHDKDRAASLVKVILKLSRVARQRYYLAPNIKRLKESAFTDGMEFIELLGFNTVYLERHDYFEDIGRDEKKKGDKLLSIISPRDRKSLVYAGSYAETAKVAELVVAHLEPLERPLTVHFAHWLRENYQKDWVLADLAQRGVGVHNGRMHRSLSQLQIRLFEHPHGFDTIVSTSSIIEGVNTSAQNVVIWKSKLGANNLKDFTYKNIIGRGGRMFKYFVGSIYLLDAPPPEEENQLEIDFPDEILGGLDEVEDRQGLTDSQIERIIEYRETMSDILGADEFARLRRENRLQDSDAGFLLNLATDMRANPAEWRGFGFLNSSRPADWDRMLFKVIELKPGAWDDRWTNVVTVTKELAYNWQRDLTEILTRLKAKGIGIEDFFKLERAITFKLAALLNDANELHKIIIDQNVDVSSFIGRLSHAFLPGAVYHLEEYGLPRMIAKKIHRAGLVDFADPQIDLKRAIDSFQSLGLETVLGIETLSAFDRYIVKFFFEGITPERMRSDAA
jgi:hypothetical protein